MDDKYKKFKVTRSIAESTHMRSAVLVDDMEAAGIEPTFKQKGRVETQPVFLNPISYEKPDCIYRTTCQKTQFSTDKGFRQITLLAISRDETNLLKFRTI